MNTQRLSANSRLAKMVVITAIAKVLVAPFIPQNNNNAVLNYVADNSYSLKINEPSNSVNIYDPINRQKGGPFNR